MNCHFDKFERELAIEKIRSCGENIIVLEKSFTAKKLRSSNAKIDLSKKNNVVKLSIPGHGYDQS